MSANANSAKVAATCTDEPMNSSHARPKPGELPAAGAHAADTAIEPAVAATTSHGSLSAATAATSRSSRRIDEHDDDHERGDDRHDGEDDEQHSPA